MKGETDIGFRTIDICSNAEIHIKDGQLLVTTEEGTASIPVEDISQVLLHGANIRLSSMDLSILAREKVAVMTLDDKYLPMAIVLPFNGHSRQSKLMHAQVSFSADAYGQLWLAIIRKKIRNQSRVLSILGLDGAEKVAAFADKIDNENVDYIEAQAAQEYFSCFHEGLNRRVDDPVNSRLNYGYAVVRSSIARSLVAAGFHPTFGIHHNNQLNAFNLADDLIEPFRAIVDLTAHSNIGSNVRLSKTERYAMAHVLHHACLFDETKVSVLAMIDMMVESLKRIMLDGTGEELAMPVVIPIEDMEGVTE